MAPTSTRAMRLSPQADGSYRANGSKYYIGNANQAALVATFGKLSDSGDFVFFAVESKHPAYELVQNVVNSQSYVAEYRLVDYPVSESDILARGQAAWDMALEYEYRKNKALAPGTKGTQSHTLGCEDSRRRTFRGSGRGRRGVVAASVVLVRSVGDAVDAPLRSAG